VVSWWAAGSTCDSQGEVISTLAEPRLQDGESLESALKRFQRKLLNEDIIREIGALSI
jgi:hypothetical protein